MFCVDFELIFRSIVSRNCRMLFGLENYRWTSTALVFNLHIDKKETKLICDK